MNRLKDILIFSIYKIVTLLKSIVAIFRKETYSNIFKKIKVPLTKERPTNFLHILLWFLFFYMIYFSLAEPSFRNSLYLILITLFLFYLRDYDTYEHRQWWKEVKKKWKAIDDTESLNRGNLP